MSDTIDIDRAVEGHGSGVIAVFNPSSEEQIGEIVDSDKSTVDAAVKRARETFDSGVWRKLPAKRHRGSTLQCCGDHKEAH